jgi:autotransporter-associated beta strand protein
MRSGLIAASLLCGVLFSGQGSAQNATWLLNPGSGDFNTAANWNPAAVPTGTASFGASNTTAVSFSASTSIGGFTLNPGASNYTFGNFGPILSFTGAGIAVKGGSATFTNTNGIIEFFNASTAGTAAVTNINSFTLFFNTSTAGAARMTNNSGGITNFLNTSAAGNAIITNNNAGGTGFLDTSTAGSAVITNNSGGVTSFAGFSTAGNASVTNVSGGFTQFFNNGSAGGASISNGVGGLTTFFNSSTAGTANIANISTGSTLFFNTSSAGSATITNGAGGVTMFSNASTAGSATITNSNILSFNDSATAGSATILNQGAFGTLSFNNAATAGNANIANQARLNFNDTSTAGNAIITTGVAGYTTFAGASTGGNARLVTTFGGVVDTSNLATGGMTAGSIEGAGVYFLGSKTLTVGGNNLSTTVSGEIVDGGTGGGIGGSLVKVGSGALVLTSTNTYSGSTNVNGGTLEVDGSIASSNAVFVNSGGTLSGVGTVDPASTQIASGGTLAPGNAPSPTGTLTLTGNLAFSSGAIYLLQISGANASRTNVAGSGFLAGTVAVGVTGSVQVNTSYDILHAAGGLNGTTFSGVHSLSPGFVESLSYSATDVFLSLTTANLGGGGGLGGNQQNVAMAINNFFNAGGSLPQSFVSLFNLSGAPLANALTQLSGEAATGAQQTTFDAMGLFMGLLIDPFMNRVGGFDGSPSLSGYADEALGYAAASKKTDPFTMFTKAQPTFEHRWSVWAAGFGGSQSTDGNAATGSNNTTSNIAGTAVGADYLISPTTIAGFALAGGGTNFSVANGGTGRSDLFQFGTYVRHSQGQAYVSAALAFGWQDITTNRTVTVAGLDQLRAEFNANAYSGRLEGGYRFVTPWIGGVGITPYVAAQFVTFDLPAYMEQAIAGTNNFALAYGPHDATDVRSELGIRTDRSWLVPDGMLTLHGRFAWAHDYDPDRSIAATFQALPGASFVVNGAAQAAESALATASIEMKWKSGWSAAATFEGEFSNVTQSYAGKGVVRYQW